MKCETIRARFPDYLVGETDENSRAAVNSHLAACPTCRRELEDLTETWTRLGVLPEEQPSDNLRRSFYTMLESYKQELEQDKQGYNLDALLEKVLTKIWPRRPLFQLAFTILLLAAAFFAGHFIPGAQKTGTEQAQLQQEAHNLNQTTALSLLRQRSSSDRLMGVNRSTRLENPDRRILNALLDILDNDPNVNVRISAVDALYLFSADPLVKQGLIRSLARQESPLVQIALIDLLVEIRERRAADALKELIENRKIDPQVRQQAQLSLQKLI